VKHLATPKFWDRYRGLPVEIQRQADAAFELLKADPRHPSLHLKQVGRFSSARVGLQYRVLGVRTRDEIAWFWIGTHAEYDRLLG
jgi:hypothetical protein